MPFNPEKIKNAVKKAFQSVQKEPDEETLLRILNHINIEDNICVEEIQNQIENALMYERLFDVAKSFMLYRQKHKEDREVVEKSNSFWITAMQKIRLQEAKYDANSNVENKNIATLIGELPKSISFASTEDCWSIE